MAGHASGGSAYKALRMALDAVQSNMPAFEREAGGRVVVEGRALPIHFVVAHLTVRWELRQSVRGVGRGVVVF